MCKHMAFCYPSPTGASVDYLEVFLLHQRLSGFPTWCPRVHTRIALLAPNSTRAVVFDRIPVAPRSGDTLASMLTLHNVRGQLRMRRVRLPLSYVTAQKLGETKVRMEQVGEFNKKFDHIPFHLIHNNCRTYTDTLSKYLLTDGSSFSRKE